MMKIVYSLFLYMLQEKAMIGTVWSSADKVAM